MAVATVGRYGTAQEQQRKGAVSPCSWKKTNTFSHYWPHSMPRHGQSNAGEYCDSFAHISLVRVRGNESSDDACGCSPEMKRSETPRSGPIPSRCPCSTFPSPFVGPEACSGLIAGHSWPVTVPPSHPGQAAPVEKSGDDTVT